MEQSNRKSLMMLHLAVALFGLAGVIGKFVSWPAVSVTFGRVFFSSLFLLIFMSVRKEKLRLDTRFDYVFIALAGVVMAVHWTTFIHSIQISSVAIGTITFSTFPLFVTFLEPLIYKEKLKFQNVIIAVIMLIGVFITVPEFSLGNQTTVGVLWGMVGSLTYAILSLMNRYLSGRYTGRQVCLYEQGTATIVLFPFMLAAQMPGYVGTHLLYVWLQFWLFNQNQGIDVDYFITVFLKHLPGFIQQ